MLAYSPEWAENVDALLDRLRAPGEEGAGSARQIGAAVRRITGLDLAAAGVGRIGVADGDAVVINFSSIAAIVGRSGPAGMIFNEGYAAANRGVSLLTETWARMGAPQVRVNEIMLGLIATRHAEKTRGWGLLSETCKKALMDHTLLQRTGTVDDVVKTVLYIIKDASFMTGTVLRLDGVTVCATGA